MSLRAAFIDTVRQLGRNTDALMLIVVAALFYGFYYPAPYSQGHAQDVRLAVVDEARTPLSRQLVDLIEASPLAKVAARPANLAEARTLLVERKVDGVLLLPDRALEDALRGQDSGIALWINGTYLVRTKALGEAIQGAIVDTLKNEAKGRNGMRIEIADPVVSQPLFNPDLQYGAYIFPAVTPVILQQTMLFGTAVLFAGRRRRGWNDLGGQWLALSLVSFVLTLTYFGWFFAAQDIPRQAGIDALLIVALFGAGAIAAFSLFAARLFSNARAALLLLIPTSLPIFFFSGATWPREAMPGWVSALGALLPSTHASRALLLTDQMGAPLSEALRPLTALVILTICFLVGSDLVSRFMTNADELTT